VEPIEVGFNGRPRELVLFELVDESVAAPPPAALGAPEATAAAPKPVAAPERESRPVLNLTPAARAEPDDDNEALDLDDQAVGSGPTPRVSFEEPLNLETELERLLAARVLSPDSVGVLVNLGWTLGLLGRFDDAERELRRAQKLAPEDIAVRAGLGLLSYRRGLYPQAEAELRWVCEQDPEHGPAHFYRGEALNRLGRVDQALEALERAVRLQPTNHRAFYTLGILFDRKNLREEAAAMYRKARELQRH
jgi:tetratricopeptide (TPR) repeat protein